MSTSLSLVPASDGGEGSASGDTLAVVYSDGSVDDMQRDVRLWGRQAGFARLVLIHLLVCDRTGPPLLAVYTRPGPETRGIHSGGLSAGAAASGTQFAAFSAARHSSFVHRDGPVLPPQINQDTMGLILEYARYHATPGHSDKVRPCVRPNTGVP